MSATPEHLTPAPSTRKRTLTVLLVGAAFTVLAFLALQTGDTHSLATATASEATASPDVSAPEWSVEALRSATTTTVAPPPTTTTTAPPPTTTTPPAPPHTHPVVTEPAAPAPAPSGGSGDPSDPASWDRLASCETGGTMNWAINTGNGYYGGLQFALGSWQSVGGVGYPHEASRETQIAMGQRLYASGGWGHWPACTRSFGWR